MSEAEGLIEQVNITKLNVKGKLSDTDLVAVEYRFELWVNQSPVFRFSCSPNQLRELVLGFLYDEGYISQVEAVKDMKFKGQTCEVTLNKGLTCRNPFPVSSPFGDVSKPDFFERLCHLMQAFQEASVLFQKTGCFHAAAVANQQLITMAEDIGRHNAVDKAIGQALVKGISPKDKMLITSCRLSRRIVQKAIYAGIPLVVSKSAVTNQAIKLAQDHGLRLIGFLRNHKANLYT